MCTLAGEALHCTTLNNALLPSQQGVQQHIEQAHVLLKGCKFCRNGSVQAK
jgi:hypothetical protein